MNKKDLIPVALLVLLLFAWMLIDRTVLAPKFAPKPVPASAEADTVQNDTTIGTDTIEATDAPTLDTSVEQPKIAEPEAEEIVATLKNEKLELQLTSLGGGIKSAILLNYPELNEENSAPVALNFSNAPALMYEGIDGLAPENALNLEVSSDTRSAVLTRKLADCVFERTISLGDDYLLTIKDRFITSSETSCLLPPFRLVTGHMENPADMKATKGVSILGVDSYTSAEGINYWGRRLNKLFKNADKAQTLDAVPEEMQGKMVEWVAAKNKFFTQIIRLEEPVATMAILASRDNAQKGIVPQDIAAALAFQPTQINAGEALQLDYSYYIGPKQYSILKAAGNNMEGVMEFETTGFWSFMNWLMQPARQALLWTLNILHGIFHNYGIAIILLTLFVRILFWPLTHKSTESMRRMQELQPEIKAIQAKYKGKKDQASAQKMQAETMALYREKKVNPMGGCLPMFVQIPVFIALFTVLRNAIELRYAGFLWIADLSSPENLLMGKVPVIGSLNILPVIMSISMIWQQKLSSPGVASTPEQAQQQKMMMIMMPIMMLFFFYSMPSGLVLYWTTSNLLMIAQTSLRNLRKKKSNA
jgi:YidC/Oxa1 family membrane protein insertase